MVAPGVEIMIVSKAQFTAEGLVMPLLGGGIVPWFAVASLMGQQREVSPWTVMAGGVFAAVTMGVFVVSGARSLPWYLRNKPSILQKQSALESEMYRLQQHTLRGQRQRLCQTPQMPARTRKAVTD